MFVQIQNPASLHERGVAFAETALFLRTIFGLDCVWVVDLRAFYVPEMDCLTGQKIAAFKHVRAII